jgi:ribosomal protein S27E
MARPAYYSYPDQIGHFARVNDVHGERIRGPHGTILHECQRCSNRQYILLNSQYLPKCRRCGAQSSGVNPLEVRRPKFLTG